MHVRGAPLLVRARRSRAPTRERVPAARRSTARRIAPFGGAGRDAAGDGAGGVRTQEAGSFALGDPILTGPTAATVILAVASAHLVRPFGPLRTSFPRPPLSQSFPPPARRWSSPSAPNNRSFPSPAMSSSSPLLPLSLDLPWNAVASRLSLPDPARIQATSIESIGMTRPSRSPPRGRA